MVERARSLERTSRLALEAKEADCGRIEFRHGEIEHLPIADHWADAVISNCVINLSPEKEKAFGEAFGFSNLGVGRDSRRTDT